MRKLTLIAVGVVLAAGSMAWAMPISVPVGPFVIKYQNYDVGTSYPAVPVSTPGPNAVNAIGGQVPPAGALPIPAVDPITGAPEFYGAAGPYGPQMEDAWAVFRVTSIENEDGSVTYWSDGDGGKELVGMLYGLVDTAVGADPYGGGADVIWSDGLHMDIYEQDHGDFASAGGPQQGTAGRLGFAGYNGVTNMGGVLQVHAYAAGGTAVTGDPEWAPPSTRITGDPALAPFWGVAVPGSFVFSHRYAVSSLTSKAVVNSLPGFPMDPFLSPATWVETFDGGMTISTATSDLYVTAVNSINPPSGQQGNVGDWTFLSQDPVRAHGQIIPEPITMLGMCMGAFGLGRYIRRRRRR
jgi:hypothetical protein